MLSVNTITPDVGQRRAPNADFRVFQPDRVNLCHLAKKTAPSRRGVPDSCLWGGFCPKTLTPRGVFRSNPADHSESTEAGV